MAKIIAVGIFGLDIDGLACIIALQEILKHKGEDDVLALLPEQKAASVPARLRLNGGAEVLNRKITKADTIILVDSSDKHFIKDVCGFDLSAVREIYDHHFTSFDFWKDKLGDRAKIEKVGAAATLIYEKALLEGAYNSLTENAKELLATAIISNSQNFTTSFTCDRDRVAFAHLKKDLNLPDDWARGYFKEVEELIFAEPLQSLKNDTKPEMYLGSTLYAIAQLEMWSTSHFLDKYLNIILQHLNSFADRKSFFISASLSEGRTYFVTEDLVVQKALDAVLNITFNDSIGKAEGIILRKDVVHLLDTI